MTRNYQLLWDYTNRKRKTHEIQETKLAVPNTKTNHTAKQENKDESTTKDIPNNLQALETATKQTQTVNVTVQCECQNDSVDEQMRRYNTLIQRQNDIKNFKTKITDLERIILIKEKTKTPNSNNGHQKQKAEERGADKNNPRHNNGRSNHST